jgi:FAD/FMN-containing dehydrogenase
MELHEKNGGGKRSVLAAFGELPAAPDAHPIREQAVGAKLVRFYEMEYCIPAEHMGEAIKEMRQAIEQERFAVHFPLECRYVKQDDIWLSPAYERDSAFIAVHMYKGMPYEAYFSRMEQIFRRFGGRPHWGKMHNMTAEHLHQVYPRLPDFLAIRAQLDPDGMFVNPYLSELFGLT